jgi:hypothetical protein
MLITEIQRQFLLSLLADINGASVWVDRETFDATTSDNAANLLDDLRYKILAAI